MQWYTLYEYLSEVAVRKSVFEVPLLGGGGSGASGTEFHFCENGTFVDDP